ncbi:hypothetical protein [Helicobacter pylori]|uniref:hypothetical protein n=1 Tax=Helicobacter pylori TaxID=210 RepID=UPI00188387AC|nr:hypothetical protein [Helicobacter pylori]
MKRKSVSGVLALNFTPKKGGSWLSGWFKRYKGCGWIKTDRYDCLTLLKKRCFSLYKCQEF